METLPDPLQDRQVKTLACPPHKPLPDNVIYPYKGKLSTRIQLYEPLIIRVDINLYEKCNNIIQIMGNGNVILIFAFRR